jgi:hypothetical protein
MDCRLGLALTDFGMRVVSDIQREGDGERHNVWCEVFIKRDGGSG